MSDDRAKLLRELERLGERRRRGLEAADEATRHIAELLPAAVEVGITKVEIHRITGVSRPTIDSLLRRRA